MDSNAPSVRSPNLSLSDYRHTVTSLRGEVEHLARSSYAKDFEIHRLQAQLKTSCGLMESLLSDRGGGNLVKRSDGSCTLTRSVSENSFLSTSKKVKVKPKNGGEATVRFNLRKGTRQKTERAQPTSKKPAECVQKSTQTRKWKKRPTCSLKAAKKLSKSCSRSADKRECNVTRSQPTEGEGEVTSTSSQPCTTFVQTDDWKISLSQACQTLGTCKACQTEPELQAAVNKMHCPVRAPATSSQSVCHFLSAGSLAPQESRCDLDVKAVPSVNVNTAHQPTDAALVEEVDNGIVLPAQPERKNNHQVVTKLPLCLVPTHTAISDSSYSRCVRVSATLSHTFGENKCLHIDRACLAQGDTLCTAASHKKDGAKTLAGCLEGLVECQSQYQQLTVAHGQVEPHTDDPSSCTCSDLSHGTTPGADNANGSQVQSVSSNTDNSSFYSQRVAQLSGGRNRMSSHSIIGRTTPQVRVSSVFSNNAWADTIQHLVARSDLDDMERSRTSASGAIQVRVAATPNLLSNNSLRDRTAGPMSVESRANSSLHPSHTASCQRARGQRSTGVSSNFPRATACYGGASPTRPTMNVGRDVRLRDECHPCHSEYSRRRSAESFNAARSDTFIQPASPSSSAHVNVIDSSRNYIYDRNSAMSSICVIESNEPSGYVEEDIYSSGRDEWEWVDEEWDGGNFNQNSSSEQLWENRNKSTGILKVEKRSVFSSKVKERSAFSSKVKESSAFSSKMKERSALSSKAKEQLRTHGLIVPRNHPPLHQHVKHSSDISANSEAKRILATTMTTASSKSLTSSVSGMSPMHCKSHQNVDPKFVCPPDEPTTRREGFKAGKVRKGRVGARRSVKCKSNLKSASAPEVRDENEAEDSSQSNSVLPANQTSAPFLTDNAPVDPKANKSANNPNYRSSTNTASRVSASSRMAADSSARTAASVLPNDMSAYVADQSRVDAAPAYQSSVYSAAPSQQSRMYTAAPSNQSRIYTTAPSGQSRIDAAPSNQSRVYVAAPSGQSRVDAAPSHQSRKNLRLASARPSKKSSMNARGYRSKLVSQIPSRISELTEPSSEQFESRMEADLDPVESFHPAPEKAPALRASRASRQPSKVSRQFSKVKQSMRSAPDVQSRYVLSASPSRAAGHSEGGSVIEKGSYFDRPAPGGNSSRRVWSNHSTNRDVRDPSHFSTTSALRSLSSRLRDLELAREQEEEEEGEEEFDEDEEDEEDYEEDEEVEEFEEEEEFVEEPEDQVEEVEVYEQPQPSTVVIDTHVKAPPRRKVVRPHVTIATPPPPEQVKVSDVCESSEVYESICDQSCQLVHLGAKIRSLKPLGVM